MDQQTNLSSEEIKKIGYWKCKDEPLLPLPIISKNKNEHSAAFINKCNEWIKLTDTIKKFVVALMSFGANIMDDKFVSYMGHSTCRICDTANGDAEYKYNGFMFPEGIFHYVVIHNIIIDDDFKDMILKSPLLDYKTLNFETAVEQLLKTMNGMSALHFLA
jgi:hypothetical protein